MTTPLSISFQITGTTVNDTLLRLYGAWRELQGRRYPAELSTYYRVSKEPISAARRTDLLAGTAPVLRFAEVGFDAVKFSADSERIPGKTKKGAITFYLSHKNPVTVVVEAKLRLPLMADAYSQLLRAMAAFGSERTKQSLLTTAFQARLSKLLSDKEAAAWNDLRSLATELEPEQNEKGEHGTSGHWKYPPARRKEIAKAYWRAKFEDEITRLDSWADFKYEISAKTVHRYAAEFPEVKEEVRKELGLE